MHTKRGINCPYELLNLKEKDARFCVDKLNKHINKRKQ